MYYLNEVLVKRNNPRSRWEKTDISQMTLQEVYQTFNKGYLKVQRGTQIPFWVSLDTLFTGLYRLVWTQTLEMWLQSFTNATTLPNLSLNPTLQVNTIKYADGWRAGYNALRVSDAGNILSQVPLGEKRDLLLTKDHTDYQTLENHCLITVNGFVHRSYHEVGFGIRVRKGGESVDLSKQNDWGIISFREVATLKQIDIEDNMITAIPGHSQLSEGLYINLNENLVNKTLILCLGGYLHILDNTYNIDNRDIGMVKLVPKKINLIPRLFESYRYLNLETLPRTILPEAPDALKLEEVWSNEFIKAYLQLPQSFAIVLDTPEIYFETKALESSLLPGKYQTYKEPIYPVYTTTGHIPEYWVTKEDDVYVLSLNAGYRPQYQYDTTTWVDEPWVMSNLLPFRPVNYSVLMEMRIGKETVLLN